jgi:poly[(R)-3-hydroxyalkanoate] polymerase subunit PhaC
MSERVQDTERESNGKRDAKDVAVARTAGPRDRQPAAAGKADGEGNAPDGGQDRAGEDADRVAAAVGGGEAIGPAGAVGGLDPLRLFGGLRDLMQPTAVARETARLMLELTEVALGTSGVSIPEKDKRFADSAWTENPAYRRLAQSYFAWSAAVDRLADNPELESDWRRLAQARYTGALITAAAAPTNFLPGNPAALKRAFDTGGLSVARGARNALRDLVENRGMPAQVDSSSFKVGENLAATPGAVIYRDEICEILQYQPTTARVRERPLLMIPPQVNKYYFLDLAPERSMVEYLVGKGVPYFTIVWRNPRQEHGDWGLEDYVRAQLRALDVVRDVSGSDDVNVLGACAGGLTTGLMLAHLAAKGDESVNSATFAIAMIDSSYPNSLRLVSDRRMLDKLSSDAASEKVYDSKAIATNFAWMRPNDLVFNYVSNDWLMGNDPPAFDILAWNNDATNLVARFDADMLEIYAENKAATPGALTLLGTPIDLREVTCDNCVIAGQTDHITPWMPCYMTTQRLSGASEVILTSTGHIQTIVNPPGKKRARYFAGPEPGPDPQAWLREATEEEGSWWPRYADWLLARSGVERDAPKDLGSANHPPGDPAPGRYVRE